MADAKWYVVHTYSGYENKVKTNIEKSIENLGLQNEIFDVSVPVQDVIETKANGQKAKVSRKLFPGYVLVNMIMNDDTWYVVRNTRGVTGFVGPESKPVPLTEEEMKYMGVAQDTEVNEVEFVEGDKVVVVNGAWLDTRGVVRQINTAKQTLTIIVDMFGRETPVEIDIKDVIMDR
jgi:transcriptional antiterminator NusG